MKRLISLILPLGISCTTSTKEYYAAHPCEYYRDTLGENHQCTNREGGALDEFEIRRELTSRVISEGQFLTHKEYGRTALIFDNDGHYEARKLHFTQYWTTVGGKKRFLVYAEDSKGSWSVEKDGTVTLSEPDESTCPSRESGGKETISAHLKYAPRTQPFHTIDERKTYVAFDNNGWLKDFHGYDFWQGEAVKRADVQWPPYPVDDEKATNYRFEGFDAVIHYGCLNKGFAEFRGNTQIYLAEEFRFDEGVRPYGLKAGTRLRTSP